MSFRDNLLHLRASRNMTQEQLAMMLGVSRQSVTKWEAERSAPEMDKLLKLCQIFDCTLDDLVQGDLTDRQPDPAAASGPKAPPADVFGYDEHMRRFAVRIALGVFLVVFGVAVSLIFFGASDPDTAGWFELPENIGAGIGTMCVLAAVLGALGLFIPAGLDRAQFVRAHPFIEDFYTAEQKAKARSMFTGELIGGIAPIFFGICLMLFLDDGASMGSVVEMGRGELTGTIVLLLCVSVGAALIVHGSLMLARTNLASYNMAAAEVMEAHELAQAPIPPERKQELLKESRTDREVGALCGVIMLIATMAGLVMLFVPGYQQPLFWLAWPVGGILCGIVSLLMKGFSHDDRDE